MNRRFIDLKKTLGKFIANFSTVEEDGKTFIFDGDEIREGLAVSTYDDKGDVVPVEDGEYTIKGVKVDIVNGLVSELPDKDSKPVEGTSEPTEDKDPVKEPERDFFEFEAEGELRQRIADLEAEIALLKEENEDLKQKAAGTPVPQRTEMSRYKQGCNDDMKGTRFDRAAQIFGSK